MPVTPRFTSSCICGNVLLEAFGRPIVAVACHCADCRAAGRQIEGQPGAAPVLDSNGDTAFSPVPERSHAGGPGQRPAPRIEAQALIRDEAIRHNLLQRDDVSPI